MDEVKVRFLYRSLMLERNIEIFSDSLIQIKDRIFAEEYDPSSGYDRATSDLDFSGLIALALDISETEITLIGSTTEWLPCSREYIDWLSEGF